MNLKELKKSRLGKSVKINERCLITGIVMLIITVVLFFWAYSIGNKTPDSASDFTYLLGTEDVKEGIYSSLTVTQEPYVFAEYDDSVTSPKYYFLWSDNLLNIGYLDYETYTELKRQTSEVDAPVIYGKTKKLPIDVIDLAIDAYNEVAGENFLTRANYRNYIGDFYLDVVRPVYDNTFQLIGGFIFLVLSFTFIIIYFVRQRTTKKTLRSRTEEEWKKILEEVEQDSIKEYKKLNLYLTENYIIDLSSGLVIIDYKNIVWMYQFQMKRYGITTNKNIVIVTNDKRRTSIANMDNFTKRSKKDFTEIMNFIISKNESIVLGYTKENRKQMKDLYGIK